MFSFCYVGLVDACYNTVSKRSSYCITLNLLRLFSLLNFMQITRSKKSRIELLFYTLNGMRSVGFLKQEDEGYDEFRILLAETSNTENV